MGLEMDLAHMARGVKITEQQEKGGVPRDFGGGSDA